jgi:deoxycytidylate deaminase
VSKQQQDITAIIYDKRGRVLAIGKNSYVKTHPLQMKYSQQAGPEYPAHGYAFIHAEVQAIIRCADLAKAKRISVFRVRKDGSYGMAQPCKACQLAIKEAGIQIVEHT